MLNWIWIIYIAATLVQLGYWLGVFSRLAFYRQPPRKKDDGPPPGVSVIICARNEAENLRKNLPHFLKQNYRFFEIIVINDNSSDETLQVLLEFQNKSAKLRTVSLTDGKIRPGKKKALSKGIQIAKFNVILLSDADCFPASENWLDEMQSILRDNIQIGLGYGPYLREQNLLNLFICFETTYTATQYLSFALIGLPYMGVGRNLIYDKALFFRSGGFQKHERMASGDDDLFVNTAASFDNTAININPEAFVFSEPEKAWRGYYYQKARHLTTGTRYKPVHQMLLGGLSLSHSLHYVAAIVLLFSSFMSGLVFLIYLVRIGVVSLILGKILKKLQDSTLIKWIPVLDFAFFAYYLLFAPSLLIGSKVKQWKP